MDDVFSNFTVVITIGNQTLTLNLHRDEAIVYLAPGNYTVSITVYYTVKPNPHGPPNVVNKPLITIKPAGEHEHEETSTNSTNLLGPLDVLRNCGKRAEAADWRRAWPEA